MDTILIAIIEDEKMNALNAMVNNKPSLGEVKDNLLRSPYYYEMYLKEEYRVCMQSYNIEERWKCFYSVMKTTFPFLSTFSINSPSQTSVLIHSHGDDYGSIETLRDIFVLGKPYVDLHQVSSMISHLKHNHNASISQLLQLMLSHYVRMYPRSRVLQLLDDNGIVNVKIIASSDEEKLAIVKALEVMFHNIADKTQRGAETSSTILGKYFQCMVGEIEELSGQKMQFCYEENPRVVTEAYSVAVNGTGTVRKCSETLEREVTNDKDMPCHKSTLSAYLRHDTSGDIYLLMTCGHNMRTIPPYIEVFYSNHHQTTPIVLKQLSGNNEEASVGRWGPWMFPDKQKINREWISWLSPQLPGVIPYFWASYDPSTLATEYGYNEPSLDNVKRCVSDVAVVSLKNSSAESQALRVPMQYLTSRSPSRNILSNHTSNIRGSNYLSMPPPTKYRGQVKYTVDGKEVTLNVIGQGHSIFSESSPKPLHQIYYVATHVEGVMLIHGHSAGAACIAANNTLHSFLTARMKIPSPRQQLPVASSQSSSDVHHDEVNIAYYYLLTPAHFALAQALELINKGGEQEDDIANLKIVDVEWVNSTIVSRIQAMFN